MLTNALRPRLGVLLVAGASLLATGCPKSTPGSVQQEAGVDAATVEAKIPIKLKLDDKQREAAKQLVGKIRSGRFPNELVKDKQNARLFLYLAATEEKPDVIMAALQAMKMAFTSSETYKKKAHADQDYGIVIAAYLKSAEAKLQGYALEAAPHAVSGKDPYRPAIDELISIATTHKNPAARAEGIDRLRLVRNFQKDPKIAAAFMAGVEHEQPYLVSKALFGLRLRATGLVNREAFLAKARKLLTHSDPGVRGRAAELAGRLGAGKDEIVAEIQGLLEDENPFTRSAAASALAHMGHIPSVHRIIKMVGDSEKNTYDLRGFTTLSGRPGSVHHAGSAWSQVRDAAIRAVERLSMRTEDRFKADRVDSKNIDESLKKNAKAAKAWYAKNRASLPKEEKKADQDTDKSEAKKPQKAATSTADPGAAKAAAEKAQKAAQKAATAAKKAAVEAAKPAQ